MNELMRFDLDNGGSVIVEIASTDPGIARASRAGDAIRSAATSFESAMSGVRDAAVSALRYFRDVPQPPDEVTIEFGVALTAQAGAVIAQTTADVHLQVTLAWRRSDTQPGAVGENQSSKATEAT